MYIKLNDKVKVIAGKDKGKTGKIIKIDRKKTRAIVENCKIVSKKIKRSKDQQGKEIKKESFIHLSNLALMTNDGKITKVSFRLDADGKKERFSKLTKEKI